MKGLQKWNLHKKILKMVSNHKEKECKVIRKKLSILVHFKI